MLNINYSLIVQMVNFVILLFLLNIIVYRPVRRILKKRKEEISSSEDSISDFTKKADRYSEEIEENVIATRKEGLKERSSLREEGLSAEKEMLQNAYAQVEEAIGKAKEEIRDKIDKAGASLREEMEAFSHELAEKILGRSL